MDILVSGVGTGGTITGVGEVIKSRKPSFKVIAVEPDASPVLSGGVKGSHKIQGIGAGFVPDVLNTKIYDEIIRVTMIMPWKLHVEWLAKKAYWSEYLPEQRPGQLFKWRSRPENEGKLIVVIIPSFGERYLIHGSLCPPGGLTLTEWFYCWR